MSKITFLSSHPDPESSHANRVIFEKFHSLLPEAEMVSLAKLYPDWRFNIKEEQDRLEKTDLIIFDFPIWWYAMPWTMQKYISDVFAYDFAYGKRFALENKKLLLSFTCGGGEKSYTKDGLYHCTITEIMSPVYATAHYCRLVYLDEVVSYHMMPEDCPLPQIIEKAEKHAEQLAQLARG